MTPETASRKKRAASSAVADPTAKADSDVDHRKRRRNRTTQSCLNCHTSKRMCDRKRPACARCTQLGLTGLCVYEVDDPTQRSDGHDESSRLLKRVAELEGVIRELKNKPHPRWSQDAAVHQQAGPSSPEVKTMSLHERRKTGSQALMSPHPPSINTSSSEGLSPSSSYFSSSSHSSPSPILTPVDGDYNNLSQITTGLPDGLQDVDLASLFVTYPDLASEFPFHKGHHSHCGCLHEASSYSALLELSVRLRKAANTLARSPSHCSGVNCSLQERVNELDSYTSTSLGNILAPPEAMVANSYQGAAFHHHGGRHPPPHAATIAPLALQNTTSWEVYIPDASALHDPFMNWEPSR